MKEPLPTQPSPVTTTIDDSDEIDLIALARTVWDGRRILVKTVAVFFVLGLLAALFSPKQYTATTITWYPRWPMPNPGSADYPGWPPWPGINLNMMGSTSDINPAVYPQIISSIPFQLELMQTPLNFKDIDQPVTLYDYYTEYSKPSVISYVLKYTIGLPGVILKAIKGKPDEETGSGSNGPIRLTEEQEDVKKTLDDLVSIDYNILMKHTGIDQVVNEVVKNLGNVVRAWLTGDMAAGSDSHTIDIILVGQNIDQHYLSQLKTKAEKMIDRAIHTLIITPAEEKQYLSNEKHTLLLWENSCNS